MIKFKKFLALILAVMFLLSFASCNDNKSTADAKASYITDSDESNYTADDEDNVFMSDDPLWQKNKICCSVKEAFYSDGKFVIRVVITNNLKYDKKITAVVGSYIRDAQGNDIINADNEFSMDDNVYVNSADKIAVELVYEKEQVQMTSSLSELDYSFIVKYEGCIESGKEPETAKDGYTVSVKKAVFTTTDGIEGSIAIRNNYASQKTLKNITFDLLTEENVKINTKKLSINIDQSIAKGEVLTISFALAPDDIISVIKEDKQFNTLNADFTIK